MSEEGKKADDAATDDAATDDAATDDASKNGEQAAESKEGEAQAVDPKEAFVQGMGLLFHAARGAFGGLKKELEKADIPAGMKSVADEMKRAADAAIHGKPRENEPEWVQPEQKGARIQTDDEPPAPDDESDEPPTEGDSAGSDGESSKDQPG